MTAGLGAVRAAVAATWEECRMPGDWVWTVRESSRATRIGLDVDKFGALTVTVPTGADPERVTAVIRRSTRWIIHHMAERRKNLPDYKVAQLVNGEGFRWEGYNTRLDRVRRDDTRPGVRKNTGSMILAGAPWNGEPWFDRDGYGRWLRVPEELGQGRAAADAIIRLYTSAGREVVTERVYGHDQYQRIQRMCLTARPPSIDVAATSDGELVQYNGRTHTVVLHWAVLQLKLPLIDYLTTHGLIWATRPSGTKYGPTFRRRLAGVHYVLDPIERDLAEDTRRLWMGDIR